MLEDSGERRPDKNGVMQVVWQLSALGGFVMEYEDRCGITFEQALSEIKAFDKKCGC